MKHVLGRTLAMVAIVFAAVTTATARVEIDSGGAAGASQTEARREALATRGSALRAERAVDRQLRELVAALARFADVDGARAAGYTEADGCRSGRFGAQGLHFANAALVERLALEVGTPQMLMYEPFADGTMRLVGVEYRLPYAAWHDAGHSAPPSLYGKVFRLDASAFEYPWYRLHVWIRFNPTGVFADWNPLVVCGAGAVSATPSS
jgi:hypothetical protein